jgi:hypothetical protein
VRDALLHSPLSCFCGDFSPTLATASPLYSPPELPGNKNGTRSRPPGFPPPLPSLSTGASLLGLQALFQVALPRVASANLLTSQDCVSAQRSSNCRYGTVLHLLSPSRPASFSRFCQWQKLKHSIKSTRFLAWGPRSCYPF